MLYEWINRLGLANNGISYNQFVWGLYVTDILSLVYVTHRFYVRVNNDNNKKGHQNRNISS